ncbi:hypothetical protein AAIO73_15675 [Sphingomonas sp. T9W2]
MNRRGKKPGAAAIVPRTDLMISGHRMDAAYCVPQLAANAAGPWQAEADKYAWTDLHTGLPCIIRRMPGGYLSGFVGVPAGHPLYGWSAHAVPSERVRSHGGLDYARPCDESGPEAISICHVRSHNVESHDDAWWFGFSCDKLQDLVPDNTGHAARARTQGLTQTYRDSQYVLSRCEELANDLAKAGEAR